MAIHTKLSYRFNETPIKIKIAYLMELKKTVFRFTLNRKRCRISQVILNNKDKTGSIIPPLKWCYKGNVKETA